MRDKWTDERLDDLKVSVDDGFRRVDSDLGRIEDRFGAEFRALNARFDSMQRAMLQAAGGIIVALLGLIATQL